jgi:hypothetical protein
MIKNVHLEISINSGFYLRKLQNYSTEIKTEAIRLKEEGLSFSTSSG